MTDELYAAEIEKMLAAPVYFRDVVERFEGRSYRALLRAWGVVRERRALERDELGRYVLAPQDDHACAASDEPIKTT